MYTVRIIYFGESEDRVFDTIDEAKAFIEEYRNTSTIAYLL